MINIGHLRNKIIHPVIDEYKNLIRFPTDNQEYYKKMCCNLMVGTALAETHAGHYLYDEEYSKYGLFGFTNNMLGEIMNDVSLDDLIGNKEDFDLEKMIYDLNLSAKCALIFYIKSGGIDSLIDEFQEPGREANKMTKIWLDHYKSSEGNPGKFFALYSNVVMKNTANWHKDSNHCMRCGFIKKDNKEKIYHKNNDARDYNYLQPENNNGRNFNDERYFK